MAVGPLHSPAQRREQQPLTFEFRMYSTGEKPGAIANDHLGPCMVYVKKVDDISSDKSAGSGWFKIWEDGLDTTTGTWCVDRLIETKGLLSVDLPAGLPAGYYLVRPEILALHSAPIGDPQFYTGCAQIFVQEGPNENLRIPSENQVSIPRLRQPYHARSHLQHLQQTSASIPDTGPQGLHTNEQRPRHQARAGLWRRAQGLPH